MDFLVAYCANGNLLAVYRPQDAIEARRFPFVGEFSDVSNVMHGNLPCVFSANATGFS